MTRTTRMKRMFYAKIAMRGACTESPREWLNTAGAYLVQAPDYHALTLGEDFGGTYAITTHYTLIVESLPVKHLHFNFYGFHFNPCESGVRNTTDPGVSFEVAVSNQSWG